jgi:ABC-type sugar transport system ATPase subunit
MLDVVKTFPGVRAVDHVSFHVKTGEIHGLVGKNGAGKSTLMNILGGIYKPDRGHIRIGGQDVAAMTTVHAKELGIAFVHQTSQLIPPLSIAENIFCGKLPRGRGGFVDWRSLNRRAAARLSQMGLDVDVQQKVEGLTICERQMIEVAKALFADARVIILDEPTAPLPKDDIEMLFSFVRRQREQGASFIYISHYLEEVFELCDAVTVLRNGRLVGSCDIGEIDQPELVRLISGEKIQQFHRAAAQTDTEPVLEIKGLTRPGAYEDLNLTLNKGEIVGLTGLEGCGKAKLARGLFGLEPLGEGTVLLDGEPYRVDLPAAAVKRGLAYLPRDRHGLGIVGIRSVRENLTLPILDRLTGILGLVRAKEEEDLAQNLIDRLGIVTLGLNQSVRFLSGGNQQKVVFGKLAGIEPEVLLLDEPTQGVDVQAKVEIMNIMDDLAQQGVALAFISEEIMELLDVCDRILVMYEGKIVAQFFPGEPGTTPETVLLAVEGGLRNHAASGIDRERVT